MLIPAMTIPGTAVNIGAIYTAGAFDPAGVSLEMLNGGLDSGGWAGGAESIKPWMCEAGAFVRGIYRGFDSWEFVYAKQLGHEAGLGVSETSRVIHGGLAATWFLPWTASCCLVWFQAYCRQDASEWDADGGGKGTFDEYWDIRIKLDGSVRQEMYSCLPHTRCSNDDWDTTPLVDPPGFSSENRWRYPSKCGMVTSGTFLQKGNHFMRASTWGNIKAPDQTTAKMLVPTGGVGLLFLR